MLLFIFGPDCTHSIWVYTLYDMTTYVCAMYIIQVNKITILYTEMMKKDDLRLFFLTKSKWAKKIRYNQHFRSKNPVKSVIFFYINICRRENRMRLDSSFSTSGIEDRYFSFYVRWQSERRQKRYHISSQNTKLVLYHLSNRNEKERKQFVSFD